MRRGPGFHKAVCSGPSSFPGRILCTLSIEEGHRGDLEGMCVHGSGCSSQSPRQGLTWPPDARPTAYGVILFSVASLPAVSGWLTSLKFVHLVWVFRLGPS